MKHVLLLAVVSAVFGGCAKPQPLPAGCYPAVTDPMWKVVKDVNANNAQVQTLWATHSFEATLVDEQGKSRAFSGDGYLLYTKPANLLLTAGGLIKYFEVGSNDTRYWFTAFPDEVSTQWWGDKDAMTEAGARRIPIRPDLLLEVLGLSTINEDFLQIPVPVMRFNNDACAYMFVWSRPLENRWVAVKEVWYDFETKLPRLVLLFDANGRVVLRAYLSDPKPIQGTAARMQSRYELFFPENKSQMSFRLTDVRSSIQKGKVTIPNPGSFAFPEDPGVKKQIEIQ